MEVRIVLTAACCVALSSSALSEFTLTVLHTNDVHARFDEVNPYGGRCPPEASLDGKCVGGVARHMYKVKEIKRQLPQTLFLNAGDYYQGTMWYYLLRSEIVTEVVNFLKHDAISLGNHEFDDGPEGLVSFLKNATVPILACNVDFSEEPLMKNISLPASKVFFLGGMKIGIVGYLTPKTAYLSNAGKIKFTDEIECLRKESRRLKENGVDIVIGLGHSGVRKDEEIAKKVLDIGLVVGGHTHTFLYSGKPPTKDKPLGPYPIVVKRSDGTIGLVVQAYWFGKYLGFINVTYDDAGNIVRWEGNPLVLNSTVPKDPETEQLLEKYRVRVAEASDEIIAYSKVLLRGDKAACRFRECNLGNLVTDAALDYYSSTGSLQDGWSQVNAAVWNGGGLRASIDEKINRGIITFEDIITVLPFSDNFVLMHLRGKHFWAMMEHAVAEYDITEKISHGEFLQVSGIRVTYDLSSAPGSRVVALETLCVRCRVPRFKPVKEDEMYVVAMLNYIANGGDGFDFSHVPEDLRNYTDDVDTDVIIKYLRKVSPVTAKLEDRIKFVERNSSARITLGVLVMCIAVTITFLSL